MTEPLTLIGAAIVGILVGLFISAVVFVASDALEALKQAGEKT